MRVYSKIICALSVSATALMKGPGDFRRPLRVGCVPRVEVVMLHAERNDYHPG